MAFKWDLSPTNTTWPTFLDSLDKVLDIYCDYEKGCISWRSQHWKFLFNNNVNEVLDREDKAVFKSKNHPSILTIKNSLGVVTPLLFDEVTLSDIKEELSNLNTKNSSKFKNIPVNILAVKIKKLQTC